MWRTRAVAGVLIGVFAAACAKSNTITMTVEEWETGRLRQALDQQDRLEGVGLPLLASAAPQCGREVVPTVGARFINAASFLPSDRPTAEAVIGTDERLQAVAVVPKLAGAAGLRKGDILLRLGGEAAPRGETAAADWTEWSHRRMAARQALDITVLRDGQEIPLQLTPVVVCGYGLDVWEGIDIYARTKDGQIKVTHGLLQFARSDQELALVLSHEIAHNTLKHARAAPLGDAAGPVTIAAFNMVSDIIGANARGALALTSGNGAAPQLSPIEQELEADYVGLYFMANAGMNIDGAEQFWRRVLGAVPDSGTRAEDDGEPTHPTHAARFLALRDWVAEIKAKQAKGLPLVPEQHDWSRLVAAYGGTAGAAAGSSLLQEEAPPTAR